MDESKTIRNIRKKIRGTIGVTEVAKSSEGLEAPACIAAQRPDLMLWDWNMAHMDGIALVREVGESDKSPPMIVVTTEAERTCVVQALKVGTAI